MLKFCVGEEVPIPTFPFREVFEILSFPNTTELLPFPLAPAPITI